MAGNFIYRRLYFHLKAHLESSEISLILGPRQSGKTTILEKLRDDLQNTGKQTVFLNLDIIEDRQWFSSQHALIELVERRIGPGRAVVFIDEISRLENAGLFLKGLYDLKSGHKFVVTGSGSLELKSNIIEPLTGRKQTFYCYPLSFTEFVAYKLGLETADFDEEYSKVTRLGRTSIDGRIFKSASRVGDPTTEAAKAGGRVCKFWRLSRGGVGSDRRRKKPDITRGVFELSGKRYWIAVACGKGTSIWEFSEDFGIPDWEFD